MVTHKGIESPLQLVSRGHRTKSTCSGRFSGHPSRLLKYLERPDGMGHLVNWTKHMLLGTVNTSNPIPSLQQGCFGIISFLTIGVLPEDETVIHVTSQDPFLSCDACGNPFWCKNWYPCALKGFFSPSTFSTWVIYFFLPVGYFLCSFPKHLCKEGSKRIKINPAEAEMAHWVSACLLQSPVLILPYQDAE